MTKLFLLFFSTALFTACNNQQSQSTTSLKTDNTQTSSNDHSSDITAIMRADTLLKDHIRLCYDICHFAIGYEPHEHIIKKLEQKGIKIGKFQVSAALKADLPKDHGTRKDILEAFSKFNEPTYLHQVVARKEDGSLLRYGDLPEALQDIKNPEVREWRAHFHVPVFAQFPGPVKSTQSDITEVLNIHKKHLLTQHLEVETYTWEVLPDALKLPLTESIVRELEWVRDQLI